MNQDFYKHCKNPEFIVTGLPRSMTAWASVFLTGNGVICIHDPEAKKINIPDQRVAYSSSGAVLLADDAFVANNKIAIIRRDLNDVIQSFTGLMPKAYYNSAESILTICDARIDDLMKNDNVTEFSYEKLSNMSVEEAKRLYLFCHGEDAYFNEERARNLLSFNIQSKAMLSFK